MLKVLGIDPGVNGAVSSVDECGRVTIDDLPTVAMEGKGITTRKVDGYALGQLLRRVAPAGHATLVVLEDVRVMPSAKSGAAANTSLMHTKGVIEGVLGVLRMPPTLVSSGKWKRYFDLIDAEASDSQRKAAALDLARRLYPGCDLLRLAKHHNRAESLLMAHYGLIEIAGVVPRESQALPAEVV